MVDVVHQGGQGVVGEAAHEDKWVWVDFSLQDVLEEEAGRGEDKTMSLNALAIFAHKGHIGEVGCLPETSVRRHLVSLELVPLKKEYFCSHFLLQSKSVKISEEAPNTLSISAQLRIGQNLVSETSLGFGIFGLENI